MLRKKISPTTRANNHAPCDFSDLPLSYKSLRNLQSSYMAALGLDCKFLSFMKFNGKSDKIRNLHGDYLDH